MPRRGDEAIKPSTVWITPDPVEDEFSPQRLLPEIDLPEYWSLNPTSVM